MIAAIGGFFINLMILLMNTLTSALPSGFSGMYFQVSPYIQDTHR